MTRLGYDTSVAKLPGGGGSGRRGRARNADRSPGHVMVVRIGSSALSSFEPNDATGPWYPKRASLQLCGPPRRGRHFFDIGWRERPTKTWLAK